MISPKSKSSVTAQWVLRATAAIDERDGQEISVLERERLSLKDEAGSPLIQTSILERAARQNSVWGVKKALELPSSAAQATLALRGLMSTMNDGQYQDKEQVWEELAPLVPLEDLQLIWEDELERPQRVPAQWFARHGIKVTKPVRVVTHVTFPGDDAVHLLSLPVSYRGQASREVAQGAPTHWSPLMACWAQDNPAMAVELIGMGMDPWSPLPGTVPVHWTLAGALGLQEEPCEHPSKDGEYPEFATPSLWGAVRSFLLEEKMEDALSTLPGKSPSKITRPSGRF